MANKNAPLGLRPLEGQDLMAREFKCVAADSSAAIFKYDPVKVVASGGVNPTSTSSAAFIGPVLDIYDADGIPASYLPASTAGTVVVATNPNLRMQIQCSGAVTASAVGDIADLIAGAGSTATGNSGYELSSTLKGPGTSGQFRILGIVPSPDNVYGNHEKLIVVPAYHALNTTPVAV